MVLGWCAPVANAYCVSPCGKRRAGTADTDESFFVMKYELLLAYCTDLSYYLLHRVSGSPLGNHEAFTRLYELRVVFEKMRLVESKLQHQLDAILSRATAPAEERAKAALRPNPSALVSPLELTAGADSGIYRPPKLAAVAHSTEREEEAGTGEAGSRVRTTRTRRAEIMNIIREHDQTIPDQEPSGGTGTHDFGAGARAARRERVAKEERERIKFEESRFMRLDANKKHKKRRKANPFTNSLEDLV